MNKTLLITGASAGIGAAVARLAAGRGYDVCVHYNSDKAGAEATAEAVRAAGAKATLIQANVGDPKEVDRLFEEFDAQHERLDAFVNNAGVVDMTARVDEIDAARLRRMFDVNVIGAILAAGHAVRRMSTRHGGQGGVIVNVSSAAARLGSANQYVDYAASKGAIETFNKGLADEVAAEGVRVNSVRPGLIETALHGKGGLPNRSTDLAHMVPMKRSGSAEEVAEGILWLMSDAASYVTGTSLDVSGGR